MSSTTPTDAALALIHQGWDHLRLQRPLAALACWQRVLRIEPDSPAATEALAILEGATELPVAARIAYKFRSPADDTQRERWSHRFANRDLRDLPVAAAAFGEIADNEADAPARYNEALCLAWLGKNLEAIAALDLAVRADADQSPEIAVASWSIAEILRQGAGAEVQSDDLSYSLTLHWTEDLGDPFAFLSGVAPLRAIPSTLDPATGRPPLDDVLIVEWMDRRIDPDEASADAATPLVLATVVASPGRLRLSSPDRPLLEMAESTLFEALGARLPEVDRRSTPLPIRLMDAAVWLFRPPTDAEGGEPDSARRRAAVERYFEQVWITRPRHGLSGRDTAAPLTPAEASVLASQGDAVARVKLAAVVDIREQLSARPHMRALYNGYPFDRLRRRLGLNLNDPSTVDTDDITCMGRADLDALDPATLSADRLSEAILAAGAVCDPATVARFRAEQESRKSPRSPGTLS